MLHQIIAKSLQTTTKAAAKNTVLYGWGQTQALPLTKGHIDRVFNQPAQLDKQDNYALPRDQSVTHIATGWGNSLIAVESIHVYGFGLNQSGQIGDRSPLRFEHPVKYLGCGREHSHVVTGGENNTRLYSFGNNMYGQLGLGKNKNTNPGQLVAENSPSLVIGDLHIQHLVCGLDNTILGTEDGSIYGMGWSADGQLGQGHEDKDTPSKLNLQSDLRKLASSTDFTLALSKEGKLWTWGNSEYGQGMQGKVIDRILEPMQIDLADVMDIAAGGPFSVVLTKDGHVFTCGYGSLGLGEGVIQTLQPTIVKELSNKDIVKVFAATDYAAAITSKYKSFKM
ncbi:unnamed protein product [Mucor hiemalis]